ncbi:MAG: radical SAM protein [Candidatus Galacturonibacter soehngenii]|nr:radical SAM protein [Candidatus Galacturonibacter soehngenii]
MKNSNDNYYDRAFTHIYVEKELASGTQAKDIMKHFPNAKIILIDHYKDVFNRSGQNFHEQKKVRNLILANKKGKLVYPGAQVCQSFGNQHFYYTSSVMNCIYDCEYCYLQGMYPSANLVVFLNLEDMFDEVRELLKQHPVYLCVSYDTDLMALESILSYGKRWAEFAKENEKLTIEIRTKCASLKAWEDIMPSKQVIYAFTLSPEEVSKAYEKRTPSLRQRLTCIKTLMERDYQVRLCFDPMLYISDYKKIYGAFFDEVKKEIALNQVYDVSIGVFRVSEDYLKKMRKQNPKSAVLQFPYENENGVYQYQRELTNEMLNFAMDALKESIPEEKIFSWEEEKGKESNGKKRK